MHYEFTVAICAHFLIVKGVKAINDILTYMAQVARGVVGSTLAFGSIGHGFESEHRLFSQSYCISLQQAEITGEVLTERFSSSTAVVHSASYPLEMANQVAAYQW